MKKITNKKFWENALPSAIAMLEIQEDVYVQSERIETIEEAKKLFAKDMLPAVMAATRVNGCVCNDMEDFFWDSFKLREETANGSVEKFLEDMPSDSEYIKGFNNLARSYAMRRKCHTTTKHFICYCDENGDSE